MEENYVQFTMRMDRDLYEQLKESAKRNKRSIAKELEFITDDYLNNIVPLTLPKDIMDRFLEIVREKQNPSN